MLRTNEKTSRQVSLHLVFLSGNVSNTGLSMTRSDELDRIAHFSFPSLLPFSLFFASEPPDLFISRVLHLSSSRSLIHGTCFDDEGRRETETNIGKEQWSESLLKWWKKKIVEHIDRKEEDFFIFCYFFSVALSPDNACPINYEWGFERMRSRWMITEINLKRQTLPMMSIEHRDEEKENEKNFHLDRRRKTKQMTMKWVCKAEKDRVKAKSFLFRPNQIN